MKKAIMLMQKPTDIQIRKIYDTIHEVLGDDGIIHPFCVLIPYRPANSTHTPDVATVLGNMSPTTYVKLITLAAEMAFEQEGEEDIREIKTQDELNQEPPE